MWALPFLLLLIDRYHEEALMQMELKDMPRRQEAIQLKIQRTMKALAKNNMNAYYANTAAEAVGTVEAILNEGDTISCGGSVTLDATGIKELMRSGRYNFLDREAVATPEERDRLYREVFFADAFITSTNAITESGELYNVDGTGNRVAAMMFGPKKVIVVAGYNKIVHDLDAAALQVKTLTTPANALRLNIDTPCTHAECPGADGDICAGCRSEKRMCSLYSVMARQKDGDRVHVVIIGEEVGY